MNYNVRNKGITLVALVITIVVLSIITGVTIAAFSNNSIVDKSKKAKDDTIKMQTEEEIYLYLKEWNIENANTNQEKTLEDFFDQKLQQGNIQKVEKEDENIEIVKNGYIITINSEGKIIG